jgi:hypothetical protein
MSSRSNDGYFLHNNWIEGEVKCMCNLPIKKRLVILKWRCIWSKNINMLLRGVMKVCELNEVIYVHKQSN